MKTKYSSLLIAIVLAFPFILNAQCSVPVVIEQGVECKLPKIISNNEFLLPCEDPFMISNAPIGTQFLIDYVAGSCFSVCQQGTMVVITCATLLTASTDLKPSPFSIYVDASGQNLIIDATGIKAVQILDLSGKAWAHYKSEFLQTIDVSSLPGGIYVAQISTDKGTTISKFIK